MKKLLVLVSLFSLMIACGSAEKKAHETEKEARTEVESTAEEIEAAIEKEAQGVEDAVEQVQEEANSIAASGSHDSVSFKCGLDNDQRVIEVKRHNDMECDVYYTKFGNQTKVGGAQYGADYCAKLAQKVKSNLESAGFSCSI